MKNKIGRRLFAAATALVICAGAASAQKAGDVLTIEPHVFENEKNEKVEAEFGRLKVPEDRSRPGGKTLELAFVRFKSTSPKPGNPIVYLAGGPGGSGIDSAKYGRFELFMAMRKFGDVIAFDQRGTGLSEPRLTCPGEVSLPVDRPLTRELLNERFRTKLGECVEEWENKGHSIRAYNTNSSADDLEDLRKALGAEKLDLWGISYGTHLALATIKRHPEKIGRAILAGVEGPDDTLKLPSNTEALIDDLARRVAGDRELSKAIPDLKELIGLVLAKLEKEPVTVSITDRGSGESRDVVVGKFDIQFIVGGASGNSGALAGVPMFFMSMSKGDFSFLNRVGLPREIRMPLLMSVVMDCSSGVSKERMARIENEAKTALLGDAINAPYLEICDVVGSPDLGDSFREPVKTGIPTLFISGTLDGRTPVSNAEAAIEGFSNASHLVIEDAAHSDDLFISSPRITQTIERFMSGNALPKVLRIRTSEPFRFAKP